MKSRILAFLALPAALVAPAAALDRPPIEIKSDVRPGALPSLTAPGEIAINRADGRFFYRDEAGNRAGGLLPDLDANGYLKFRNGMTIGRYQGGKFISQPDSIDTPGSAAAGSLNVQSSTVPSSIKAPYFTLSSRSLFGRETDWLGNGAGGSASQYAYGSFATGLFLSPIGDVGVVGAVRTEDINTSGRLPIGLMGWAFNFKTTNPQTAWGGYYEARRKKGAGQIHALEVNVTDLGDGSDRIIPSAMKSGANAVYSPYASGLNVAAGGNVTPGQQTGWNGTANVTQAANVGSALAIYNNAAQFEKGIIVSENAIVGCDGTGFPKVCTGVELGRGTDIGWIDGSARLGSLIRSDVSPSGNGLRAQFTDFGFIVDGYGGATLNVIAKSTDVNGVQIQGGGVASSPARILASGSANASLGLAASGLGVIQLQSIAQLTPYTIATLPPCDASRRGGMAYVTDAAIPTYRNGVVAAATPAQRSDVPVFCAASGAWEAH